MKDGSALIADLRAVSEAAGATAAGLEAVLASIKSEKDKIAAKLSELEGRDHALQAREQAHAVAQSDHSHAVAEFEAKRTAFEAQRQDYAKIKAEAELKLADVLAAENTISRMRDEQKRQLAEIERQLAELSDKSKSHDNREKELTASREQLDQDDARIKELARKAGVKF